MKLKPAILAALSRDDLKRIVDDLDLEGVDRRSVDAMRSALSHSRKVSPETLLGTLKKDALQSVCESIGLPINGTRETLVQRLLLNGDQSNQAIQPRSGMHETSPSTNGSPSPAHTKKPEKLTLPKLESKLFKACDILRGNMDASEYKEYIFGMLFLKRLSDQFVKERDILAAQYKQQGLRSDLIERQLNNPDKYDFFVPDEARWSIQDAKGRNSGIAHLKNSVGSGLNKALAAIEDANPNTLQDVLKTINFNRKIGQRSMDDSTLVAFIQHFNEIPLSNDDFEFPDLLGAAYEYLIKYFADSAGKKGGEFYTPSEVVRMMVQVVEPHDGMSIYDPCGGAGGMLIQSKQYVQEVGGDPRNLALAGQELNGSTWAICKMNMILHGIRSADIRHGDTIRDPLHLDKKGEIRRFDRVLTNPPFSQNYSRQEMKFPERFHTFLPESGKKADLMFVQHMVASLKSDGKMATVMPHGVLFRGGEEKACRQRFIKDGILEAVIGLPAGLFYGTGIPACILVINKNGATDRKTVLFINADREYKEGKNQNSLRPEDIEKITQVYRTRQTVEKYSRLVPLAELEKEEFNLNIRRYVDNSPPPEPHDVRAHLHGGIPVSEINQLAEFFANYDGVKSLLFRDRDPKYSDFVEAVQSKNGIKSVIDSASGLQAKHVAFQKAIDSWWKKNVAEIERLPETKNVFELRRHCIDNLAKALTPQGILTGHQVRGAVASYIKNLDSDLKSVAASGWGAELIPEEQILQSQFPEVLVQIEKDETRIAELEGLFAAANESEDEDADLENVDTENGVLPKALVKALKDERKLLAGEIKDAKRQAKADKRTKLSAEVIAHEKRLEEIDLQLERHSSLDAELKQLKANIREVEKQKDEMIAAARAKINEDDAKRLILKRFQGLLTEQFDGYLRQYQRSFIAGVENLWQKYAVTTEQILAQRAESATQLNIFLKELGYD
jgi:type I restriction enzyme M protein